MHRAIRLAAAAFMATAALGALSTSPVRAAEPGVEKFQTDPQAALAEVLAALPRAKTRFERITLLAQQATLEDKLGHDDAAAAALARAKALLRPADDLARAYVLHTDAAVRSNHQDYAGAETIAREALALFARLKGPESVEAAYVEMTLGRVMISQSKFDEGIPRARHVWDVYRNLAPPGDEDRFDAGFQYAVGLVYSRQAAAAEAVLRGLSEEALLLPPRHAYRIKLPNMLGTELLMQGRINEAIPWLREAVDIGQEIGTQMLGEQADNLATLGIALLMQDRPDDALPFFDKAIPMFAEATAIPSQAGAYINGGTAADRAGDRPRGLAMRQQGMALLATLPKQSELALALNRFKLAQSLANAGRLDEAEPMARQAADVLTRVRPEHHFQNTNPRISLGWIEALQGKPVDGLARVKAAFRTSVATNNQLEVSQNRVVGVLDNVESYSQALQTAVLAGDNDFAFEVLQVMVETDASRAAVAVTAREQAGDSVLGTLLRQRQEAAAKVEDADAALLKAQGLDESPDRVPARTAAETALTAARSALAALDADLDQRFPAFRGLLRPRPVTLAETQARLGPNETVLVACESDLGVYTMAISHDAVKIGHSPLRRQPLRALVRRVRAGTVVGSATPFDTAAAADLASAIFTPEIAPLTAPGTRLRFVTGDILSALPLSLLVTHRGASLADTRWLIEDHPLSVLPSLAALAPDGAGRSARQRFVAIGAPALAGTAALVAGPEYFAPGTFRSAHLADLPPLPGAAQEIASVAQLLGKSGKLAPETLLPVILTGAAATEPAVRALDLGNVGVLLLATHGLVAGAFDAQSEPALVLTPPPASATAPESKADGLLTASEAATLHIDADWVILSACDTAAGNYPSAAGYTGLARAFLFAGARRVVASHWPVRDDVAARLTVGLVKAAQKGATPDEALQRAILGVMHDRKLPDARNPAVWAPFMVVAR